MNSIKTFKLEETKRLIQWISENYEDWRKIVDSNLGKTTDEYLYHFKLLLENQFYEVLTVYIFMNRDIIPIYDFLEILGMQHMAENWDHDMLEHFHDYILKEAETSKQRKEEHIKRMQELED